MKHRRLRAVAVFSFIFICFFPNPALPIGSNTGLQAGQVLAVLTVPIFLLLGWVPRRHTQALLVLALPIYLAGYMSLLSGRALSGEVVVNNVVASSLVLIMLIPVGAIVRERYIVPLLSGAAAAIVCHTMVGLVQAYWFSFGAFPLAELYQNPSFRSPISEDPENWALYVKRPFGLFPEPSAMAASTGPWLVLFLGLVLRGELRPWAHLHVRALLTLAIISGVGLIIMSRSGYTIFLIAGFMLVSLPMLRSALLRLHRPRGLLTMVAFVLVGAAVTVFAISYLDTRVESEVQGGSSWPLRFASILLGLNYLGTSVADLLFGAGPGQSSLIVQSSGAAGAGSGGEAGIVAVWSVIVTYIQETGLVGVAALILVLITVLRVLVLSSAPLVGLSCLLAWLGGVMVTTSYLSLLPVWIFLALLLGWDYLFDHGPAPVAPAPESARL